MYWVTIHFMNVLKVPGLSQPLTGQGPGALGIEKCMGEMGGGDPIPLKTFLKNKTYISIELLHS